MRHTRSVFVVGLAAIALAGCFDAHVRGGDADAGPRPGDGGPVILDCDSARFAIEGAACDFDGACTGGPGECGPPSSITCVDGRIRTLRPICTRALARNCDDYLAWGGVPGEPCFAAEFEGCTLDEGDCCARRISCEDGSIVDETVCGDCEPGVCPGYAAPPPEYPSCTSSGECEGGLPCVPGGTPRACGFCREPELTCASDADCAPGDVCIEETAPCSCGGASTLCAADCRLAESDPCGDEARCGPAGACVVIDCGAGWACPLNARCHAGLDGALDAHGCARLSCDDASDCDCGVCLDGTCQEGPGACLPPVP